MILGVIDIETTGFLPKGKIVEVGIALEMFRRGILKVPARVDLTC